MRDQLKAITALKILNSAASDRLLVDTLIRCVYSVPGEADDLAVGVQSSLSISPSPGQAMMGLSLQYAPSGNAKLQGKQQKLSKPGKRLRLLAAAVLPSLLGYLLERLRRGSQKHRWHAYRTDHPLRALHDISSAGGMVAALAALIQFVRVLAGNRSPTLAHALAGVSLQDTKSISETPITHHDGKSFFPNAPDPGRASNSHREEIRRQYFATAVLALFGSLQRAVPWNTLGRLFHWLLSGLRVRIEGVMRGIAVAILLRVADEGFRAAAGRVRPRDQNDSREQDKEDNSDRNTGRRSEQAGSSGSSLKAMALQCDAGGSPRHDPAGDGRATNEPTKPPRVGGSGPLWTGIGGAAARWLALVLVWGLTARGKGALVRQLRDMQRPKRDECTGGQSTGKGMASWSGGAGAHRPAGALAREGASKSGRGTSWGTRAAGALDVLEAEGVPVRRSIGSARAAAREQAAKMRLQPLGRCLGDPTRPSSAAQRTERWSLQGTWEYLASLSSRAGRGRGRRERPACEFCGGVATNAVVAPCGHCYCHVCLWSQVGRIRSEQQLGEGAGHGGTSREEQQQGDPAGCIPDGAVPVLLPSSGAGADDPFAGVGRAVGAPHGSASLPDEDGAPALAVECPACTEPVLAVERI